MADLKAALKEAKRLIVEEKNEEAMELCEKHINDGAKDYMLFCFAALANANQKYPIDASTHYLEAIKLDAKKPMAWQGLFKLYDTMGLQIDERAIVAAEKVAEFAESDEKREYVRQRRREFLWYLRRYSLLKDDCGTNLDFLKQVAEVILDKENKNETEKSLLSDCLGRLGAEVWEDQKLHLAYVRYRYETSKVYTEWGPEVIRFCENHAKLGEWIVQRLEFLLHIAVFKEGLIPASLWTYYDAGYTGDREIFPFAMLNAIFEDDWEEATDAVLMVSESNFDSQVLSASIFSSIRVLFEDESYERCLRLIAIALPRVDTEEEIREILIGFKAQTLLNMNTSESIRLARNVCPLPKKFELIEALIRLRLNEPIEEKFLDSLNETRFTIHKCFVNKELEKARNLIKQLESSQLLSDRLLIAEVLFESGIDPLSQLVQIVKDRPRCSRGFYLLANYVKAKNFKKAKSFAGLAVKIQPTNEEYVKLLDDILVTTGDCIDERISILSNLKNRCTWAQERLYPLLLEVGKIDEGIHALQQLIRTTSNNAAYWATLGSAYLKRGSLQAAVHAYSEAYSIEPNGSYEILMLHVLLRLGEFENIISKYEEWKKHELSGNNEAVRIAIDVAYVQAKFRICEMTTGKELFNSLNEVLFVLDSLLSRKTHFTIVYKITADVLAFCTNFQPKILQQLKIPKSLNVGSSEDCWKLASSMLSIVLSLDKTSASAWADMGIILTRRSQSEKTKSYAIKAIDFLKQAIRLAGDNETRSNYWIKLADALRIAEKPLDHRQHCLIRALELNRSNAEAWCRIALLFGEAGLHFKELSKRGFESAMKVDPQCATTWTGYGYLALIDSNVDEIPCAIRRDLKKTAIESFMQALAYKPSQTAVENLSDLLVTTEDSIDPTSTRVEFGRVLSLQDLNYASDAFILRLALLAEQFGYFEEGIALLNKLSDVSIVDHHKTRMDLYLSQVHSTLPIPEEYLYLNELATSSTNKLEEILTKNLKIYHEFFERLPTGDKLHSLCRLQEPTIHVPLLISYILMKKLKVPKETKEALHKMRPRHQLLDVWPTDMDEEMSNELAYLEEDGEEPFRIKHRLAKDLFEQLSELRQNWLTTHPPPTKNNEELLSILRNSTAS